MVVVEVVVAVVDKVVDLVVKEMVVEVLMVEEVVGEGKVLVDEEEASDCE